jgi:hypothetical protein
MMESQMWLENGNWIPELLMDERGIEAAKNPPEIEEDLPSPDVIEHEPATHADYLYQRFKDDPFGLYGEIGGEGG